MSLTPLPEIEEQLPEIEELEFERESVERLYRTGAGGINPERWERARDDVLFEDVVSDLTGSRSSVIRCPFHGRDSRPSFQLYPRTNSAFCFGCPPGSMYYDSVTFVSKYLEISRVQALRWIEKNFDLPKLADVKDDEDEDENTTGILWFWDLAEHFILKANQDVQSTKDVELAEDYLRIYFTALAQEKAADDLAKIEGDESVATDMHINAAKALAAVLGKEKLDAIADRKAS